MRIKTNDKVKIIAGKNKGNTGKVLQVFPDLKRASVEGVNLLIKNLKPKKKGEKGQIIQFPSPIHLSNIALICSKCACPTRVNFKFLSNDGKDGKKVRICKKCKEIIE